MSNPDQPAGFSLRRWSRRKHEAARPSSPAQSPQVAQPSSVVAASSMEARIAPAEQAPEVASHVDAKPRAAEPRAPVELPPVESMTLDSDFTPFMQPGVDESLKRSALKKLFTDPRFNVMDGLDVYIDDYSKPDPLDPAIARTLVQARYIFDPPKTRVNAQGHVEDVPEEVAAAPQAVEDAATDAAPAPALVETPADAQRPQIASPGPDGEPTDAARADPHVSP
jgi:hypothetical protein